jgi:hypothetical protein
VLSNCRETAERQFAGEEPPPILLTKPIDYPKLRLELSRTLRSHTGQMLRVVEPFSSEGTGRIEEKKL